MPNLKNNQIKICCYLLFALFFIINLLTYGYAVYFLEKIGISYMYVGIIIGVSALLSSILQPVLGRIIDVYHYSWQKLLILLNLCIIISVALMFFTGLYDFFFGVIILISSGMYPFVINSSFYYEENGINTNFGVARGCGALSYCIFSLILGFVLNEENVAIIPLLTLITSIMMIITLYIIPYYGFKKEAKNEKSKNNIFIKYPVFTLLIIGMIMIMTFHTMFESYMINIIENIGGSVVNVGISNSIASFVEIPVMFLFIRILDRVSAKKLIFIASVFYIVRAILIFQAKDPTGIYISQVLQMISFAIILPATVHFTNELMDDIDQYEGQAILGATITIGLILANFIGGNILQFYNVGMLLTVLIFLTVIGTIFTSMVMIYDEIKFRHT